MDSYLEGFYRSEGLEDTIGDREVIEPLGLPGSPPMLARAEQASDITERSHRVDAPQASASRRWLQWIHRNGREPAHGPRSRPGRDAGPARR